MKTASIGVNKTTLVPTLSHSARGGQEGEALPFVVTSRCSTAFPLPESGSCTLSSAHKVTRRHGRRFSSPQLSIQVRQQKSGGGGKEYPGKQARKERDAKVGPNPTRAEEESQAGHTQRITEDESPREIHVFISVCKVLLFLWPYRHPHASSMSFSPFASSFPLFSLSLPPPSSSSSAPSVYVSFCP